MEINLTQDQLAIVADRLTKLKNLESEVKNEKSRFDDFILGVLTSNGVSGSVSYEIKEGTIHTKETQ